MATIYIDTNIAIDENFFRSATAYAAFKACGLLGIGIVIPEIVIDELKGNYLKKLKERISALNKAHKDVAKLITVSDLALDADAHAQQYSQWLEEFLIRNHIHVAPYPNVSLKNVVEQSYSNSKPFKASGEGHKDYLIWRTVVQHINSSAAPSNFLLTNNTKDFCGEDSSGAKILHPDLANQIAIKAHIPEIHTSLKAFFDAHIAAQLPGVPLNDFEQLGKSDIEKRVQALVEEELPLHRAFRFSGLPFNDDVTVSSVGSSTVNDISLLKVEDEIIIDVTGTVEIEVDGFIDKWDYFHMVEDGTHNSISINDGDWNDHVMWASKLIDAPFSATLIYSISEKTFSDGSVELTEEISDYY